MHKQTNFWEWVRQAFQPSYQKEIEEYLAEAEDHFDLEHRMQVLTRRGII